MELFIIYGIELATNSKHYQILSAHLAVCIYTYMLNVGNKRICILFSYACLHHAFLLRRKRRKNSDKGPFDPCHLAKIIKVKHLK